MSAEIVALIGLLGGTMITAAATVAVAVINQGRRGGATPAGEAPAAVPGIPVTTEHDLEDERLEQLDYWHRRAEAAEAVLERHGIPLPYTPFTLPLPGGNP